MVNSPVLLILFLGLQRTIAWSRGTLFPNAVQVTSTDTETLIKQTGQVGPSEAAKACGGMCQHGYAQVFQMNPLPSSGRINSGIIKLTCPLLVHAVDALEDEGFMEVVNTRIAQNASLTKAMHDAHVEHAEYRKSMLTESDHDKIKSKIGERGAKAFMQAGVAGSSIQSMDVKCLHAWLGDYLFRRSESPVGKMVADELKRRGITLHGDIACSLFCTGKIPPPTPRNKQRHKTSKEIARRKRRRMEAKLRSNQ